MKPFKKNENEPAGQMKADEPAEREQLRKADPCIVAFHQPDSFVGEQYRKLKTAIVRMTGDSSRNLLMVTSALSGEGKSITSLNLGVMLARDYGKTVLVIDADLRRGTLHQYLGIDQGPGLTDILEDNLDPAQAIVKTDIPKLSLLRAGKKAADSAELLSSPRLRQFLHEVKHRYPDRYIIMDTSPALLFSEAQVISTLADGVLLVVKEGLSTPKTVQQVLDLLNTAPILGIIYNDAVSAFRDARYHHYYRNYHYSGNGNGRTQTVKA